MHLQRFVESERIDFFQNGLEGYQRLLQDLMPMVLREINDNRNKHWESLILVSLQNVQEVVIFKETHSSVGYLEMNTANALHDSLEQLWDQWLNFVYFANLQNFLQLRQKQGLFDAVSERPVFQKTLEERDGQSAVFG